MITGASTTDDTSLAARLPSKDKVARAVLTAAKAATLKNNAHNPSCWSVPVAYLKASKAAALKEKNIEVKETSFFSSVTDTFGAAQAEIDKQLKEVTAQAAALPGNISSGIQSAGADVTNKLNALITLLERVNQKPPEETEEENMCRRSRDQNRSRHNSCLRS